MRTLAASCVLSLGLLLAACAGNERTPSRETLEVRDSAARLALSFDRGCALASDERVYCWGLDDGVDLGASICAAGACRMPVGSVASLVSGRSFVCGRTLGDDVSCWGRLGDVPLTLDDSRSRIGELAGARALAADSERLCALDARGALRCVVLPESAATIGASVGVVAEDPGVRFPPMASLSTGDGALCGLGRDGYAYCAGRNRHGRIDPVAGERRPRIESSQRLDFGRPSAVWVTSTTTCALARDRRVRCLGGSSGEDDVGNPLVTSASVLPLAGGSYEPGFGSDLVCVREARGEASCWEATWAEGAARVIWRRTFAASGVVAMAASHRVACALARDDTVRCDELVTPGEREAGREPRRWRIELANAMKLP